MRSHSRLLLITWEVTWKAVRFLSAGGQVDRGACNLLNQRRKDVLHEEQRAQSSSRRASIGSNIYIYIKGDEQMMFPLKRYRTQREGE